MLEATGWRPGLHAHSHRIRLADQRFELFTADGATHLGEPSDPAESSLVEWLPDAQEWDLLGSGKGAEGLSPTAVLWWLCVGA